ncbi:MAG: COX15/CtaA family protein [Bacteroidota bacterium]
MLRSPTTFRRLAWATLTVTILVVLWGAFVRASGSGAGCGDHWPLCNGEVIPRAPSVETMIEMTHRITSGIVMLMALALFIASRRAFPKAAHPRGTSGAAVRRYAGWALFFMGTEAALGAALVLLEFVAYNVSVARGYWMAGHLVNTFLLLGAQGLTLYAAYGGHRPRIRSAMDVGLVGTLAATTVLCASGAVAALGDTLTIGGGIDPADDPIVATLVGLRIVHPTLACFVVLVVLWAVWKVNGRLERSAHRSKHIQTTQLLGGVVIGLYLVQMGIGLVNVALKAPVWIQIVHLAGSDAVWLAQVWFVARLLDPASPSSLQSPPPPTKRTVAEIPDEAVVAPSRSLEVA